MSTRRVPLAAAAAALIAVGVPISAAAQPWDGEQTWAAGVHGAALEIAPEQAAASAPESIELAGHGLDLRYRINARWELVASAEKLRSDDDTGVVRVARGGTFSARLYLSPRHRWAWYAVVGLGGASERVSYVNASGEEVNTVIETGHGQLGAGVERRFRRFGIGIELRAVGVERDRERTEALEIELDAPAERSSSTSDWSGAQLNVAAAYYF